MPELAEAISDIIQKNREVFLHQWTITFIRGVYPQLAARLYKLRFELLKLAEIMIDCFSE